MGLAIRGPDESLALIVALGLARAGIVSAPTALPAKHLAAVFVQPGVMPPSGVRSITFDESWLMDHAPVAAPLHPGGDAIFRIFSTSGTSGVPRHCAISHARIVVRFVSKAYPFVSLDWPTVVICALGLGGTTGTRAWLATLHAGGTLVFTNPREAINAVLRHKVTAMVLSPASLQAILSGLPAGLGPLPSMRALKVGGSQLPAKLARAAADRLCRNIVASFGPTEVGGVCRGHYSEVAAIPLAVGPIVPRVEVQAVDDNHTPVPPGAEGLIRIRSPDMIAGYFDDEAATRAAFRVGWFYSGDRGAVTPDDMLIVTGRVGEFINSGGVRVNPRVIEDVLRSLPAVKEATAFGVPDADGLAKIWAAIAVDTPVDNAMLSRLCAAKLGARAPKFILQMKDLPRNANGKVQIGPLVELAASHYRGAGTPA
jgi:long-chain acyl-CoA synthetase